MDRSRHVRLGHVAHLISGVAVLLVGFRSSAGVRHRAEEVEAAGSLSSAVEVVTALSVPEIPLEVNARVEKWLHRFLGGQRPYFQLWLAREGRYGEMIRGKLRESGLPEELIYLAMIESGFSPRARSPANASGMWQMVEGTARRYGLRVDPFVDERRDPVRATEAALDYLEDLYGEFGSWYLAAAGYNAGERRVARALRARASAPWDGRRDRDLFWHIMEELPEETREYVPMMIAAMILARDPQRYGFEFEPFESLRFDRVFVPGGTPLSRIAWLAGVGADTIRALNPHLVLGVTPPGLSYPVRVPAGAASRVVAGYGRVNPHLLAMAAEALMMLEPSPPEVGSEG